MTTLVSSLSPADLAWASAVLASVGEQLGDRVDRAQLRAIVLWKEVEIRRAPLETAWAARLASALIVAGTIVSATYKDSHDPDVTVRAAGRAMHRHVDPVVIALWQDVETIFGSETVRRVVPGLKSAKAEPLYDPLADPIIQAWNRARLGTQIRNVAEATQVRVREVILTAFADGDTVDEIATLLADMYHFSPSRALLIARTEIVACSNAANHFSIGRHMNVTRLTKQWLATFDRRTRHSHINAHGQQQGYNRPFLVGGSALMFPGDGSLGASGRETIRCRCTATYDRMRP